MLWFGARKMAPTPPTHSRTVPKGGGGAGKCAVEPKNPTNKPSNHVSPGMNKELLLSHRASE